MIAKLGLLEWVYLRFLHLMFKISANFNETWHDFPPNAFFCEREADCIGSKCLRACFVKCLRQIFSRDDGRELPKVLLFLRVGLCQSQLKQIIEKESEAFKAACLEFREEYTPKLVFLCQLPFKTYVDEMGVKFNAQRKHCVIEPEKQVMSYPLFSMSINTMVSEAKRFGKFLLRG